MNLLIRSALILLGTLTAALAQPTRPLVLVVPYAAGGPTDVVGRLIARDLAPLLGRQVIVENVAGAGGTIGSARVARAGTDGNTLLLANIGHATAPFLYAKLPYRAVEDFEPVGLVVDVPMTLVARTDLPANSIAELKVWASENRGKVTIAHAGTGASSQLCALLVMRALGETFLQVPYSGTAQALGDVVGGRIDLLCDQTTNTGAMIRENRVKAFGVTSAARVETLPGVPTLAEAGLPDAMVTVWHGLFMPAGTPAPMVTRLSEALQDVIGKESFSMRLMELGAIPVKPDAARPEALRAHLAAELARWKPVIEASGVGAKE